MKTLYIVSLFAVLLSSLQSCGSKAADDCSDSAEVAADSTMAVDSIEPAPETKLEFSSSSDAIAWMNASPDADKYKSGILHDMARDELSYCTRLLNSDYQKFIIIDKNTMKLYLYDKYGREEKSYGMACSRYFGHKHKNKDNRTPDGFFSAEGIYNSENWLYTDDDGVTHPAKGVYGPKFVRLEVPNTRSIGIHGTSAPWSIGHRASHGCIRLKNDDILDLVKKVEVGMPVIVSPGPSDIAVNEREGYFIPSVAVTPGVPRAEKGWAPRQKDPTVVKKVKCDSDSVASSHDPSPESSPESSPEKVESGTSEGSGES